MDKEKLYKRKATLCTRLVELDDDVTVEVRALSRGEVAAIKEQDLEPDEVERHFIAHALTDPVMSYEEVTRWLCGEDDDLGAPAGDSVALMEAIAELSGFREGARKSGVPPVRRRRRR